MQESKERTFLISLCYGVSVILTGQDKGTLRLSKALRSGYRGLETEDLAVRRSRSARSRGTAEARCRLPSRFLSPSRVDLQ